MKKIWNQVKSNILLKVPLSLWFGITLILLGANIYLIWALKMTHQRLSSISWAGNQAGVFILRFLDVYFNYDYFNFVDRQTQAMAFMTPTLRANKIPEIDIMIDQIFAKQVVQKWNTERILQDLNKNIFYVDGYFDLLEKNVSQRLPWHLIITVSPVSVDRQNPFGWAVDQLDGGPRSSVSTENNQEIPIVVGHMTELRLPCALPKLTPRVGFPLQLFYFGENPNNLQITMLPDTPQKGFLTFFCDKQKLTIPYIISDSRHTVLHDFSSPFSKVEFAHEPSLPGELRSQAGSSFKREHPGSQAEMRRFRKLLKEYFGMEEAGDKKLGK